MGRESNLIVDVNEYNSKASEINTICAGIDSIMMSLVQYLQVASSTGLESGRAAESFSAFVCEISRINGMLKCSGGIIKSLIADYLKAIDDADDLLFKNLGYKPFTDDEFKACFAVVENTTAPSLDVSLQSWFSKLIDKLIKFFYRLADIKVTVDTDSSILAKKVDNLQEKTIEKISTIKTEVRLVDRTYRQKLKDQLSILKTYEQALRQIDGIVSISGGSIDAEGLVALTASFDQCDLLVKSDDLVTDNDVKEFADNVSGYFDSSTTVIGLICASSMGEWVTTDFDRYRATINAARDYFNSYSDAYTDKHKQYEEYKKEFDSFLNLYNEYGSKWVDHYKGDKEKAKMFNKLIEKTSKLSKKADDYVNIWFQLFCDMSESRDAFARFKENCDLDNEGVRKALERVESIYANEVNAYIYDTLEQYAQALKIEITKKGAEAATNAYNKIIPMTGVDKIFSKAASCVIDKAFSEAPAVAQYDWVLTTQNSFDNAVAKLKSTKPGTEGYDVLVTTVRETFDSAKKARLDFFNTMAKTASGQQKRFYELNAKSIKNMSLEDVTCHNAITPGEYYGENANIFGYILDGNVDVSY